MVLNNILKLREKYAINIPDEYNDFILNTGMDDYYGKKIVLEDGEHTICHFLKESNEPSTDLYNWYLLLDPEYKDYLTIAFCIYDEEIAIKVKGDHLGKVVLIVKSDYEEDESARTVYDISKNFSGFLKIIK